MPYAVVERAETSSEIPIIGMMITCEVRVNAAIFSGINKLTSKMIGAVITSMD